MCPGFQAVPKVFLSPLFPLGVHWLTRIRSLESMVQEHGDSSLYNLLSRKQYIADHPPDSLRWGQSEPQTIQPAQKSLFKKLDRKRLECWNAVIGVDEEKNAVHIGQRAGPINCTHCAMKMICTQLTGSQAKLAFSADVAGTGGLARGEEYDEGFSAVT